MRIFLTGATGFIGSYVIPELIANGHQVLGMTRSEAGARTLQAAGVEPFHATLEDPVSVVKGAERADAVIHAAFDHDFSNFMANCEKDRRVIAAVGEALKGSDRPFVVTSGTGGGDPGDGTMAREDVLNRNAPNPRLASELLVEDLAQAGVRAMCMRLPQVHDTSKQGFVTYFIELARAKGVSAYVGNGANRWSAGHVVDVAQLYRLAVEQGRAGERFHAVGEEGVAARDIAEAVAQGLGVPTRSLTPDEAAEHFGWFTFFASMDLPASSAWTRERLGWRPEGPDLLTDLRRMDYAAAA